MSPSVSGKCSDPGLPGLVGRRIIAVGAVEALESPHDDIAD